MRRCKARKATLHAGGMSESHGSGGWGQAAENLYRWVWAGRTACVAERPLGTMLSRWVVGLGHARAFQISSDLQGLLYCDCRHPDLAIEHVLSDRSSLWRQRKSERTTTEMNGLARL